jgi:hypothetical protein
MALATMASMASTSPLNMSHSNPTPQREFILVTLSAYLPWTLVILNCYLVSDRHKYADAASAEAAVATEALLTLSSSCYARNSPATTPCPFPASRTTSASSSSAALDMTPHHLPKQQQHRSPSLPTSQHQQRSSVPMMAPSPAARRVSLCSPAGSGSSWPASYVPQGHPMMMTTSTPQRNNDVPVMYHGRPVIPEEAVPPFKKARTVSPGPAAPVVESGSTATATTELDTEAAASEVNCICPVCNRTIKGLGDNKVDWSQPVQGRQRAKTITSIKKHVKDHHEHEPIWNVIVNSLDTIPTKDSVAAVNRVVTAEAFVTQALKKAALDQIPNQAQHLRSFRWTEKMMDQRVGIAKGFIQFGGQEYLRNKECQDETGTKINPKSLRNLAYTLLQSMYDDLLLAWNDNQTTIESSMATVPLGLLRNRFQLLFASPEKWAESWYMDPSKYSPSH